MGLESAAQLLATALMLLQSVSANPSLPESVRASAQDVAQKAISESTRAISQQETSASKLSCTITADKPNYWLGEIIVFRWTANGAVSAKFVQDASGTNLTPPDLELGLGGEWRKAATVKGYPFVTMKVTDAMGASATCSEMVYVY